MVEWNLLNVFKPGIGNKTGENMIEALTIERVAAERKPEPIAPGFRYQFAFSNYNVVDNKVEFRYKYEILYSDDKGRVVVEGKIVLNDAEAKAAIEKGESRLPPHIMEGVTRAVLYYGTKTATLVSTSLGLPAPLIVPPLKYGGPASGKQDVPAPDDAHNKE